MNTQDKIVETVKAIRRDRPELVWVILLSMVAGIHGVTYPEVEQAVKSSWSSK